MPATGPILAIESTCDETAAALIYRDGNVAAESVASQEELHQEFNGVVPEIAARAHVERILPIIDAVLQRSCVAVDEIEAIAVANEPGLAGSLLVGMCAAKTLAMCWQKPLITLNHIHAHIYACQLIERGNSIFPCVGFIVSGGHTNLYRCNSAIDFEYLGGTIDDAAGEAFDKVGAMLGLEFPGGPALSRIAGDGDASRFSFPRPMLKNKSTMNLSFSGLKTAVRYEIFGNGAQAIQTPICAEEDFADIAAGFQRAVVDCLVGKAMLALAITGLDKICVGGGVAANPLLRSEMLAACQQANIDLQIAPPQLCTDNAVMGAIAWEHYDRNQFSTLSTEVFPGLRRGR